MKISAEKITGIKTKRVKHENFGDCIEAQFITEPSDHVICEIPDETISDILGKLYRGIGKEANRKLFEEHVKRIN